MSIGTSVGTVVALTPLVVQLAESASSPVALFVAAVLGGAFFGDNLSFISDTTIAATRTMGCKMNDKFKANIRIALPAAIITFAIYIVMGMHINQIPESSAATTFSWHDIRLVAPYLLVIALAVSGMNVTIVLVSGIILSLLFSVPFGMNISDAVGFMSDGIMGMSELIIVTLLAAGMLGVVSAAGGIEYMLHKISSICKGYKSAQSVICILTATVNMCTANNTVAILTTGSVCRTLAERFSISPKRAASLLDISSCVMQCLIPFGAQTLLATGLAGISPIEPFGYLIYPWVLIICLAAAIIFGPRRHFVTATSNP